MSLFKEKNSADINCSAGGGCPCLYTVSFKGQWCAHFDFKSSAAIG
jgi:hypothetical protein